MIIEHKEKIEDVNWGAIKESLLAQSARDVEIGNLEHRVVEAAIAWRDRVDPSEFLMVAEIKLYEVCDALLAVRGEKGGGNI